MSLPQEPYSRIERYLAKLAGQEVDIPDKPITRIECYLDYIVNNGGGVPASNAGAHNAIFRGQSLGTSFTAAQSAAIQAGTFDDLFVGDYWTINNVVWRIAAFDYFYSFGDTAFEAHHAVIVPDQVLATEQQMNDTVTTTGGYLSCALRTNVLPGILTDTIYPAFGEGHVLQRRDWVVNAVDNGAPSSSAWTDSICDLMNEAMVLGRVAFGTQSRNGRNGGEKAAQLPLFAMSPCYVNSKANYWLQDVVSEGRFAYISGFGLPFYAEATAAHGVRPYFCIGTAS